MCLLEVLMMNNHIYGCKVHQNPYVGGLNRHFKPNMRKIQIAILSLDLCIRLTWNLTGSCGQQQSSWVVSYDGKTIPRWRMAAFLKIDISQWKIIGFSWNFVHSSRLWTEHVIKNEESCIGETPSSTERISCMTKSELQVALLSQRPRDASCLSVVSFNSTKRRVESFIVSYVGDRFVTACS